ncbi:MAG: hypothetical protein Q3971_09655 [Moraxella sp.]|nr:hypothetical protein [Moraxella sp.]
MGNLSWVIAIYGLVCYFSGYIFGKWTVKRRLKQALQEFQNVALCDDVKLPEHYQVVFTECGKLYIITDTDPKGS